MRLLRLKNQSKGFTIIELMIATAVFGVVLLLVATAIIQISRLYYKGLTETSVQNATRNIADAIAQGIQFNGGNVTTTAGSPTAGTTYAFCVGQQQYSYRLGYQMVDTPGANQIHHALVVADQPGCQSSTPPQTINTASITGRELLGPNMRLSNLEVTMVDDNLYKVSVRVVYGDDDLVANNRAADAKCVNGRIGTQFCAISELTTVITKRVD